MTRATVKLTLCATALSCAAAAAWAATEALGNDGPTVIEIEVAANELAECRATLSQVAQMPAVYDNGSPILFNFSDDLPTVDCVVR
ncbi:hypothetical protein [Puniceibacterium sp. IMCC21224]|uniref:hypothetical protein n=1 Tax=Puniceibacterium sp. IMCC21224 TaxID=1618204 RepID=UPI00064E0C7B|nr:hypothetical protein [Puniceibacterium sp. IMCC21224]KMK66483.1 hypothetical protein IMCC21224_111335 [Puniceibacterium sp. IMCC21224]